MVDRTSPVKPSTIYSHLEKLTAWLSIRWSAIKIENVIICAVGLTLAILIRYPLLGFKSSDFIASTREWYTTIREQGFAAFQNDFSTYNPPYLYLLYLVARFAPDTPNVLATKIPSLITDFICAYFVYLIVKLRYADSLFPMLAGFATLFAPTVVLNSAFWGQADVLYTAPLVASLYFLLTKRNWLAFLAFGVALSFKIQAIFLSPLLLALFLRKEVSWKHFLLVPIVLFLAAIPAWLAGRPLADLLSVYLFQAEQYQELEMSAPTVYTWMPDIGLTQRFFLPTGVILTAALGFFFAILVFKSRTELTAPLFLELALVSVMIVPFFLPKMHDRYFFPADVISIIFAFYFPHFFFVPLVMSMASFFAYQPTLFSAEPVPMAVLAFAIFVMIAILAKDVIMRMYPQKAETENTIEAVK